MVRVKGLRTYTGTRLLRAAPVVSFLAVDPTGGPDSHGRFPAWIVDLRLGVLATPRRKLPPDARAK